MIKFKVVALNPRTCNDLNQANLLIFGVWIQHVFFLNHGSFGATPIAVREEQQRWQNRLENEPVHFLKN